MYPLELITTILSIISSISLLGLVFILAKMSKEFTRQSEWTKKSYTQEVLERNTDKILQIKLLKIDEFSDLEGFSGEDLKSLIDIFNYFEFLSVGIRQGLYDEIVIRTNNERLMREIFHRFRKFIEKSRWESSSEVYIEYERLIKSWESERLSSRFSESLIKNVGE